MTPGSPGTPGSHRDDLEPLRDDVHQLGGDRVLVEAEGAPKHYVELQTGELVTHTERADLAWFAAVIRSRLWIDRDGRNVSLWPGEVVQADLKRSVEDLRNDLTKPCRLLPSLYRPADHAARRHLGDYRLYIAPDDVGIGEQHMDLDRPEGLVLWSRARRRLRVVVPPVRLPANRVDHARHLVLFGAGIARQAMASELSDIPRDIPADVPLPKPRRRSSGGRQLPGARRAQLMAYLAEVGAGQDVGVAEIARELGWSESPAKIAKQIRAAKLDGLTITTHHGPTRVRLDGDHDA